MLLSVQRQPDDPLTCGVTALLPGITTVTGTISIQTSSRTYQGTVTFRVTVSPAPAAPETGEQEADAPETDSQAPNEGLAESPQTPDAGETIELP